MDHTTPITDDADEWEEGSLPAAPTVPFFTHQDFVDVVPQPQGYENASPSRLHNQRTRPNNQFNPQLNGRQGRYHGPGIGSTPDREPRPYRPEIGGIPSRLRGVRGRQARHSDAPVENAAYASYFRTEPAGGDYTFSEGWMQLLSDLHGDKTRIWARDELNRLSRQTGTFIATPLDQDVTAMIWGDSAQVAYARAGLEEFERSIRKEHAEKRKDLGRWEKISALDARKEQREERKAKIDHLVSQHGTLVSSSEYDFEYWMLWPSEDLEFEQMSASNLQDLRKNFWCAIDYEPTTSFVRIMANSERNLLQVVNRIINLVKEIIAELNSVTKANLHQLPSKSTDGSSVRLEKNDSMLAIPIVEGMSPSAVEPKDWERLVRNNRRSNRKKIGQALQTCLKSLRLSQKHVQMRVSFGKLALRQYQLPPDGNKDYKFDEFCTMVANDRTILELQSLVCGAETDAVIDRCASHPMFVNPMESYSVHIDFKEADKSTTLRLRKKFTVSQDYRDVFNEGHQWLEFPSGSAGSLLEVNMLDFENPDWQLTMSAASFFESAAKSQQHDWFQTNVTFKPTRDSIGGKPKRRVFFKPNGPIPTLITELTTITYDLKGDVDAKFELTRKDEYPQTQFGTSAGPPISRLSASYYYPDWDGKLGQYAYLPPGGQVDWQPTLSSFFPDSSTEGNPKGLKNFLEEIKEIQRVLARKPAEAGDPPTESLLNDLPNGIGSAGP